jgi:hypothetical protein
MAQHPQSKAAANPAALAARDNPALNQALSAYDVRTLESEIDGHNFLHDCRHKDEERQRTDEAMAAAAQEEELITNRWCEGAELVASPVAGVVSLWQTQNGFGLGRTANIVLGLGAKAVSAVGNPKGRAAQIATRSAKVLIHSQFSIDTRDFIANKLNKDQP